MTTRWTADIPFAILVLAGFLFPRPVSGAAQRAHVRTIPGELACGTCDLRVEQFASLGSIDDPALIGDTPTGVVRRTDGSFVVGAGLDVPLIVFDADGDFGGTMGEMGDGPEELRMILGARALAGGGVAVIQPRRVTFFNARGVVDRVVTASFVVSGPALHVAPDGDVLFARSSAGTGPASRPFRLFDPDFLPRAAFGTRNAEEAECDRCRTRPATWSTRNPDHFWAARKNRYELRLWHEDGQLVESLTVEDSPWFEPWDRAFRRERGAEGAVGGRVEDLGVTEIVDVREDPAGLLWVTAHLPPEGWSPDPDGLPGMAPVGRSSPEREAYLDDRWDTIVEVIDPDANAVLARHRFEKGRVFPVTATLYRQKVQDDSGLVRYELVRLRLAR